MTEPHPDVLADDAITSAMSLAALAADERYSDVSTLVGALDPNEHGRLIFAFASLTASFAAMYHEAAGLPADQVSATLQRTRASYLYDASTIDNHPDTQPHP